MTNIISRRGALALGAGIGVHTAPGIIRAATRSLRIGWQKGGTIALLRGSGALEQAVSAQGVEVSWLEFTSGPPLLEAISAGALEFGGTGDVPPLFALAARGPLKLVAAEEQSPEAEALIVPAESPITSVAELKGKPLAFKRGSSAHALALTLLGKAGLSLSDVEAQDLAPPDAAAAFAAGRIAAWSIWDPYLALTETNQKIRRLGSRAGLLPKLNFYSAASSLVKSDPELVATVIAQLRAAGVAAEADLDKTIAAFAATTGLPRDVVRLAATRPGLDYGRVRAISAADLAYEQGLADQFLKAGVLPAKLDIAGAVWTPDRSI